MVKGFTQGIVVMNKRYMHGLLIVLLAGVACPLYAADSWYPSRETLQRYGVPVGLGATAGGVLGYGLGQATGYPRTAAAVLGVTGGGLGGFYQRLKEESEREKEEAQDYVMLMTYQINTSGIRCVMEEGLLRFEVESHPDLGFIRMGKVSSDYGQEKISFDQFRNFSRAIIASLISDDKFFIGDGVANIDVAKQQLLMVILLVYKAPSDLAIFDLGDGDIRQRVDEALNRLEKRNKFGVSGIFRDINIKKPTKR